MSKTQIPRFILYALCGVSISVLESGFFGGAGLKPMYFLIILAVTLTGVVLCGGTDGNAIYIFIYTLAVTFVLEIVGRQTDIRVLLTCLLSQSLLYTQARLKANAERFKTVRPALCVSLAVVLACVTLAATLTFQLYRNVLQPLLAESDKYALLSREILNRPEPEVFIEITPPPVRVEHASAGNGSEEVMPPELPPRFDLLLYGAAVLLALLTGYIAFRFFQRGRWRKRLLSAPPSKQITEYYKHFLSALAICGCPREPGETPLEYLNGAKPDTFPLPVDEFGEVTRAFMSSRYGHHEVTRDECKRCAALFNALPELIKTARGKRFYLLHYLPRMYNIIPNIGCRTGGRITQ